VKTKKAFDDLKQAKRIFNYLLRNQDYIHLHYEKNTGDGFKELNTSMTRILNNCDAKVFKICDTLSQEDLFITQDE
jgi:hypothetical protein